MAKKKKIKLHRLIIILISHAFTSKVSKYAQNRNRVDRELKKQKAFAFLLSFVYNV